MNNSMILITSIFPLEKRNIFYLGFKRQSAPANKEMQRMLAAAAITTPSVGACGATTVWANGPIAPPNFT